MIEKIRNIELNEEFKTKMSSKSLIAFESSLSRISKSNFIKIAEKCLFDNNNKNPYYTTQKSYFENISNISNSNRHLAMFNIFSLIKNDEEKMHKFLPLVKRVENDENLKYQKFKKYETKPIRL